MISLANLSLQRGSQRLLQEVSVKLHPGERIAVIGANGSGKTSFFQLLLGRITADGGELYLPKNWCLAEMSQEIVHVERLALDFVLDGDTQLRALEHQLAAAENAQDDLKMAQVLGDLDTHQAYQKASQAEQLLMGLGFKVSDLTKPVANFSGGWRMRLNLAQALMAPSDLLLLDEPTNHLDLNTCFWLENWLQRYQGTLLFISHDRDFIDGVATQVLSFEQNSMRLYQGNYSQFERQKAERLMQEKAAFAQQEQRKAEIESFVSRFKAKASKAKQAQSRLKMLDRLKLTAPIESSKNYSFRIPCHPKVANPLIRLKQADLGYGEKRIIHQANISVEPGIRVGLLGVNGAGKSTLIKALAGELAALTGEINKSQHLKVGYFAQHQLEALDLNASALDHFRRLDSRVSDQNHRNFLGRFGFSGQSADANIAPFSGGEKARLALALLAWQQPNLLLLDEPTNHLDLQVRDALNLALQTYEGAVILVSHDRYLLKSSVDTFWHLDQGVVHEYNGDLDDYFQSLLSESIITKSTKPNKVSDKKVHRQQKAAERERLKPLKKTLKQLEQRLENTQSQLNEQEQQLADTNLYEPDQAQQLQKIIGLQAQLKADFSELERQWLDISEQLEALESCG